MIKASLRVISLLGALAALLSLIACGGPVAQSHDLLGIDASPQPVRERSLEVFLRPTADPTEVRHLTSSIATHDGVEAWQYDANVTVAHIRSVLADWHPGMITELPIPRSTPRSFIVVAKDSQAQGDLVAWLGSRPSVYSVVYWSDGIADVVQGP